MLKTCAVTPRKRPWFYYLKRDKFFYLLLALPILYYIVYKYMPMFGIVIAFQDYKPFGRGRHFFRRMGGPEAF